MLELPPVEAELHVPDPAGAFEVSQAWSEFCRETLVEGEGELVNLDHRHLVDARIGWLLTSVPYEQRGRAVAGTAELGAPPPGMYGWKRARWQQQIRSWWEEDPDFIITLFAPYLVAAGVTEVMALLDHELYHCAQKVDKWGAPKFSKETGRPQWRIRGHDVEEFTGVVRRWGAEAAGVAEMVEAALSGPEIGSVGAALECGTCWRAA